jgi:hypothetical protein
MAMTLLGFLVALVSLLAVVAAPSANASWKIRSSAPSSLDCNYDRAGQRAARDPMAPDARQAVNVDIGNVEVAIDVPGSPPRLLSLLPQRWERAA